MTHAKQQINANAGQRNKTLKMVKRVLAVLGILILCAIFASPFLIMVTTSIKTNSDALSLPVKLLPSQVILENYPQALQRIPYFQYMRNTIFITVLSVAGQLLITPMVAYSLAKIKWKGAAIISALLMATMMIPYTVTMIPLYKVWSALGFTNTYLPLILPCFFGNSFYIIIMRQFFAGIPGSLMEAAQIDGTNEFQRYFLICLPLCKPVLTTVGIYAFLAAWSDYLAPLIYINKQEMLTLSLGLQGYMSEFTTEWALLMAATTMFVIPVIIFFMIFQRNFVQGIATSGLKA